MVVSLCCAVCVITNTRSGGGCLIVRYHLENDYCIRNYGPHQLKNKHNCTKINTTIKLLNKINIIYSPKKFCTTYTTSIFFVFTAVGCTASHFIQIIRCSCWFCNPSPLFWDTYCFICGRRRVAIARYRMICLVLKTLRVCNFAKCEGNCTKQYRNHVLVCANFWIHSTIS